MKPFSLSSAAYTLLNYELLHKHLTKKQTLSLPSQRLEIKTRFANFVFRL